MLLVLPPSNWGSWRKDSLTTATEFPDCRGRALGEIGINHDIAVSVLLITDWQHMFSLGVMVLITDWQRMFSLGVMVLITDWQRMFSLGVMVLSAMVCYCCCRSSTTEQRQQQQLLTQSSRDHNQPESSSEDEWDFSQTPQYRKNEERAQLLSS